MNHNPDQNIGMESPSEKGPGHGSIKSVAFVTPEAEPFFKTGGLGDVCGELATGLSNAGLDITIFTYKYAKISRKLEETGLRGTIRVGYEDLPTEIWTARNGNVTYYFLDIANRFKEAYAGDGLNFAQGLSEGTFQAIEALVPLHRMSKPDVLHAHDWAAALVPVLLKTKYSHHPVFKGTASVLTVHNPEHTGSWIPGGRFPELGMWGEHWFGLVQPNSPDHFCLLRGGISHADKINSVSHTGRREMLTPEGSGGLYQDCWARISDLLAIRNGIDYSVWKPLPKENKLERKAAMQTQLGFRVHPDIPLLGMVARISKQKAVKQVVRVIRKILEESQGGIQFIYLGKSAANDNYGKEAAAELWYLAAEWPHHVCFIEESALKDKIAAQREVFYALDIFLYPSEYEPFGTKPIVALTNHVPCVVRSTGGLRDNFNEYQWISGKGNGWVFENISDIELHNAIWRAIHTFRTPEHWERVTKNAASDDWSWDEPVREYRNIYQWAQERARLAGH